MVDPRKVIGNVVQTKAMYVTHLSECHRRFGSLAKTKVLEGVVTNVENITNPGTNRTSTWIHANWIIDPNTIKSKAINIRSVTYVVPAPPPLPPNGIDHQQDGIVNGNPENIVTTMDTPAVHLPNVPPTQEQTEPVPAETTRQNRHDNIVPLPVVNPVNLFGATPEPAGVGAPVTRAHETDWFENDQLLQNPETQINGPRQQREWFVKLPFGERLIAGGNVNRLYSRLDIFLMIFPPAQLNLMLRETNLQLQKQHHTQLSKQELLKFFGVLLLISKFEFTDRRSLWATVPPSKYEIAPDFGRTGMTRHRFDLIWQHIRFGEQPEERPDGMNHETYRWLLVDKFVEHFNSYRQSHFSPSELICVDESISRWYGQGGNWINIGLPMYIAIDRKPENGCEIQTSCCATSGVMIRMKLVKSDAADTEAEHNEDTNHGTQVMLHLIEPWLYTNRIVCADSYFSSVSSAMELLRRHTKYIGVVKQAHRQYPMAFLQQVVLNRGLYKGLYTRAENSIAPTLMAFVWVDRERRYFISSCSNIAPGLPYIRNRWRQIDPDDDAVNVNLEIDQPAAAEIYYSVCAKIDQHNRDRQSTLNLEKKMKTHDWAKRVGTSLLSICVVDTWKVYNSTTLHDPNGNATPQNEAQKQFYSELITELIDNTIDMPIGAAVAITPRTIVTPVHQIGLRAEPLLLDVQTGAPRSGSGIYLTPTKRLRMHRGEVTNQLYQGNCRVCKKKTKFVCAMCRYDHETKDECWICHAQSNRDCFARHVDEKHSVVT